jgi:Zn-dependent peptidase ImmA (M78 family)
VPELPHDGEAEVSDSGLAVIRVRGTQRPRDRFTMAHEIGHLMLHDFEKHGSRDASGRRLLFRDLHTGRPGGGRLEAQANAFAADLLMPFAWLDEWGQHASWSTERLAALFGVSKDAMAIRLDSMLGKGWGE